MRRTAPIALSPLVAGALLLSACGAEETDPGPFTSDSTGPAPRTGAPEPEPSPPETGDGVPRVVDTVASGLAAPWGIAFLPDGSALVTERDTKRVLHIVEGDVREIGEVAAAFPQVRFVPTGGITFDSARAYLAHPSVAAVGGSWMVAPDLLAAGRWDEVASRCAGATALYETPHPHPQGAPA